MSMPSADKIRNFCIIAHINHGKSTLADRLLELTGTVGANHQNQLLDSNPIEQERGITIKLAPVRMRFPYKEEEYVLNLIDTPGHVDFAYEVSRSLAACEGALLVVDAVSGVQAQTLANFNLAMEQGLEIIPVINKIDVPAADEAHTRRQLQESLGFLDQDILSVSAKTGLGVDQILPRVVEKIPSPTGEKDGPFRALVFNSSYDPHQGVLVWLRVVDGSLERAQLGRDQLRFLGTKTVCGFTQLGYFAPGMKPTEKLAVGEVGFVATGVKNLSLFQPGDTVVVDRQAGIAPLKGYQPVRPMVYAGLYPVDNQDYEVLRESLEKLRLSDSALTVEPEFCEGLGKGFRGGFLGMLHAEIVQERLSREFGVELIITPPTVEYQVEKTTGEQIRVMAVSDFPDRAQIKQVREPIVNLGIYTPVEYMGGLIELCKEKRAKLVNQTYFGTQVKLEFRMPLGEMVVGFYDQLKNVSSGFASLDWQEAGFEPVEAVRLDILFNGQRVDSLSQIVPRDRIQTQGRSLVEKLRRLIPRQQFEIRIQAALGGKIIAKESIKPFRKDVTAKLYGGDRTRRMKLLEKQKKGKKRMKQVGQVQIPQNVFLEVFKR